MSNLKTPTNFQIVTRPRTLSFFLVLTIAVLPLWSIVPLSWFFVIYSLRTGVVGSFGWRGRAWFAAALCEVSVPLYPSHSILKCLLKNVDIYLFTSDRSPSVFITTI
jgi:hypothetical protein